MRGVEFADTGMTAVKVFSVRPPPHARFFRLFGISADAGSIQAQRFQQRGCMAEGVTGWAEPHRIDPHGYPFSFVVRPRALGIRLEERERRDSWGGTLPGPKTDGCCEPRPQDR